MKAEWRTMILWCFILGFLHQRKWYSFILFPNLQCSVFVNTEEANFEILLLENKQTLANTTHIMVTGQRGDGEQYRISRQQCWMGMGIYPLGCSLIPDENHPFNKNPLHGFWISPQKPRSDNNVSTGHWAGAVILPGVACSAGLTAASHGSSQSREFSNFYTKIHPCWQQADQAPLAIKDPQNCLSMNIFTDKQV